jgi:hypothetical protein
MILKYCMRLSTSKFCEYQQTLESFTCVVLTVAWVVTVAHERLRLLTIILFSVNCYQHCLLL